MLWAIIAFNRAKKVQWPPVWPVSGRWVLVFYSGSLTLLFLDIFRVRVFYPGAPGDGYFELIIRVLPLIITVWAMWRWLSGNLLGLRDDFV